MSDYQKTHQTDVVVIGAGPGGYVTAIRLAQLGKKVMIVEKEAVGGVCLNWGCIPSKALIYVSSLYEKIQEASLMGIFVDNVRVDMSKLMHWKGEVVQKLSSGIRQLMKTHHISVVMGKAEFIGPDQLSVQTNDGGAELVQAKNFIIATGSRPIQIPGFELDGERIIDSRQALELEEVPPRFAVIGGGVIGLEIGVMYAKLGSQITVIEMSSQLVPGVDKEIAQVLLRSLKRRKVAVYLESKALKAEKQDGAPIKLTIQASPKGKTTEEVIEVDKVLMSVGRQPNSQSLGLEKAGVQTDEKGFITVDKQLRTSNPNILAIGDVTAPPLLAHKASKEGTIAADVIAGSNVVVDYRAMPAAIFTDPEVATVGLTEEEALAQGYEIRVGKFPFQASGRALSMNETEGLVKIISDVETDFILGVHMVGPDVSDLIAEATLAIEMGATATDLALTVHTHPTLPETLMEAAEAAHGKAIHIYQKEEPAPVGASATQKIR